MTDLYEPTKTLLMTTSLKGGTGKSLWACAMVDMLRSSGRDVAAYDGDKTISTLAAMHGARDENGDMCDPQDPELGVGVYNVRDEDRTMLFDSVDRHDCLILHDLAGGSLADQQRIFEDEGGLAKMINACADMTIDPVFCHMVTPEKASVMSVAYHLDLMDALGEIGKIATHIAVTNMRGQLKSVDFPFWYGFKGRDGEQMGGKTRARLLDAGGLEMTLPHMNERTLALTKNLNMPFSKAIHDASLGTVDRQRVREFVREFEAAVTPDILAVLGVQDG